MRYKLAIFSFWAWIISGMLWVLLVSIRVFLIPLLERM